MENKKRNIEEKLEKEMKTLLLKMKNENTALNKILSKLKSKETELSREKEDSTVRHNKKQAIKTDNK
jgi:hypothetical protein